MKMNFWEKSENVMFLRSLRLSFMPKIRKIYRAVLRENLVRQRERPRERQRERDRDGPEYKGPPDAIAKPSDQKTDNVYLTILTANTNRTLSPIDQFACCMTTTLIQSFCFTLLKRNLLDSFLRIPFVVDLIP